MAGGTLTLGLADAAAYALAVEADRRHGVDVLVELEPVEGRGLAGAVEPEHGHVERRARGQGLQQAAAAGTASAHARAHLPISSSVSFHSFSRSGGSMGTKQSFSGLAFYSLSGDVCVCVIMCVYNSCRPDSFCCGGTESFTFLVGNECSGFQGIDSRILLESVLF